MPFQPRPLRGVTFQMASSASCSSISTPVAPSSSVARPTTVAMIPALGSLAFWIMVWTSSAPSRPSVPVSCSTIRPRAASSPKKNPATAMITTSSGASENTV